MRKLLLCLFYGLCVFTIVFSLFWMSLPRLALPSPSAEETPVPEPSLAAQTAPSLTAQQYYLCDRGGKVAVYRCGADGAGPDHGHLRQPSAGERRPAHQARHHGVQ